MRRAANVLECLDRPVSPADREAARSDIHRLNVWFGGYWLSRRWIRRLGADGVRGRLLVIDVGGGDGQFARWLVERAGRGKSVRVVVVDRELTLSPPPGILGVCADATALPFREAAADVVTASLTLHHLEADAAVRGLAEMRAVARRGLVVNDLARTRLTFALVWLATRFFARHRFARHDGPLSVRRAYAPGEIRLLAEKAGLGSVEIHRYPWLGRLVAVVR